MKSVIRVRTSAGVYDLDMGMVARARANDLVDGYDSIGLEVEVGNGLADGSILVEWLMGSSSFAQWITYAKLVSEDVVGGNFWVDRNNFEIIIGDGYVDDGSVDASIRRLNKLGLLIEDSWRYKSVLN